MTTLMEFLTARVEDDEGWVQHPLFAQVVRDRLLADAAHKRRILERHRPEEVHTIGVLRGVDDMGEAADAMHRVMAGGEAPADGWESRVVMDNAGNVVASMDEPETHCSHDIREAVWPCPDLLNLAAVYADHPDFKPEWRVD